MPIQASIKQSNGATATYHVVSSLPNALNQSPPQAQAQVLCFLDQPTFASGGTPLGTATYDVSGMLLDVATAPASGATVQQAIVGMTEQFLLTLPAFAGATVVA